MGIEREKNVLYISYDGMTDPLGQSQVIPYLKGLSQLGYRFTLLSFEKPVRYQKSGKAIEAQLTLAGIEWVPLTYTKRPPIISTIWDLIKLRRKAFALQRTKHFSIVHCRSYISSFVGMALKRNHGVKFLFDMRGFYADERVDGKIWNLKNPIYRLIYYFFKRKEKQFLSQADQVISLTHKGKDIIHSWKEMEHLPIEVIPCCADLSLFSPSGIQQNRQAELREKLNLTESKFVLSYLGSIGTWYMLPQMLDFFKCLLEKIPSAKFLFITTDPPEIILAEAAKKNIPETAFIITPSERKELPTLLSLSDWSIFFIKPVFSKSASSPTKQGEIMGMGIPLICNSGVGDVDKIMKSVPSAGILVDLPNARFNEVVEQMINFKVCPQDIINATPPIYSLAEGIKRYQKIYDAWSKAEL